MAPVVVDKLRVAILNDGESAECLLWVLVNGREKLLAMMIDQD